MVPLIDSWYWSLSPEVWDSVSLQLCHWAQWDSFTTQELKESQECKLDLCFASLWLLNSCWAYAENQFLPKIISGYGVKNLHSFFSPHSINILLLALGFYDTVVGKMVQDCSFFKTYVFYTGNFLDPEKSIISYSIFCILFYSDSGHKKKALIDDLASLPLNH